MGGVTPRTSGLVREGGTDRARGEARMTDMRDTRHRDSCNQPIHWTSDFTNGLNIHEHGMKHEDLNNVLQ